jgi:GNAT superfamily N-acetyltransferase
MYREELPPAALLPVSYTSPGWTGAPPAESRIGPDADITTRPPCPRAAVGRGLPFKVKLVCNEAQLLRVQALRQQAYGRHLPDQAAAFGNADPQDRAAGTVILYAEDKLTGRLVGSARIQSNRHAPLQIEGSLELPPEHRGRMLAEITRLCVVAGYEHQVRLALLKAVHLYCIAMQIRGVVAGSRRSLLRTYESLGFTDLYGDERMCALQHAGGLPHRVLFRDTLAADAQVHSKRPQDYDFVFREFHPDIEVFDALAAAVSFSAARPAQAWP